MKGRLKTHLLEGGAVRFHADAVEWLVGSLKGHVVRNERQVTMIHVDAVHLEDSRYLLQ